MLGNSHGRDDATRCRYCGEKLSLLQRLSRSEYCNNQHREAFQRDQNDLALGRLQQVASEGREAAVSGRLTSASRAAAGEWPDESDNLVQALPPSQRATSARTPAPVAEYEDPPAKEAFPLCGPICFTRVAAYGSFAPSAPPETLEGFRGDHDRLPESSAEPTGRRVLVPKESQLGLNLPSLEGDRRERKLDSAIEAQRFSTVRYPTLLVHESIDWSEALERERRSREGVPPLAGLIQIAGPQTLRFEPRLRRPMALPEHPAGNPVRSYTPGLSRGGGVPSLAGAIRGLGTWRTRFGSEGRMQPQWESDLAEMRVAADWQPKYPVFFTTSPWAAEGFDEIFGLGDGNGPGPGGLPSSSEAVMAVLEPGGAPSNEGSFPIQASAPGNGTGSGNGLGAGSGVGEGNGAARQEGQGSAGAGAGSGDGSGSGAGMGAAGLASEGGIGFENPNAYLARGGGGTGAGAGSGKGGPGPAGMLPGAGDGGGFGTATGIGSGLGEGRGVVSVEAVAALVKAARQSDRSRTPLRDVEIKLLSRPAAPLLAAPQAWRGLKEGCARGLAGRGPILTKAPYEPRLAAVAATHQSIPVRPLASAPRKPVRPVSGYRCQAPVVLRPGVRQDWNEEWLCPVPGRDGMETVPPAVEITPPKGTIAERRFAAGMPGRASHLQPVSALPEPWVRIAEAYPAIKPCEPKPSAAPAGKPSLPLRVTPEAVMSHRRLGLGSLEAPGSQWVMLSGGKEGATFRLALGQLGAQESGSPRAAEWGPVGTIHLAASRAGLPAPRGIVHRGLELERRRPEPWLEPVMCQFGPATGGTCQSRT